MHHAPCTMQVPAVADTKVVDVTGAGNACCGGMLAALHQQRRGCQASAASTSAAASSGPLPLQGLSAEQLADACAWGTVSASFMVEEAGVPRSSPSSLQTRAQQRFAATRARARITTPVTASAASSRRGHGPHGSRQSQRSTAVTTRALANSSGSGSGSHGGMAACRTMCPSISSRGSRLMAPRPTLRSMAQLRIQRPVQCLGRMGLQAATPGSRRGMVQGCRMF